jgi:hypothetical protein
MFESQMLESDDLDARVWRVQNASVARKVNCCCLLSNDAPERELHGASEKEFWRVRERRKEEEDISRRAKNQDQSFSKGDDIQDESNDASCGRAHVRVYEAKTACVGKERLVLDDEKDVRVPMGQ